jgi:ATP-dependent Lhr-like helicase
MRGPASVAHVLAQLEGFEAPAAAWESEILPSRIVDYEPGWLDALCLSGRFVWLRRTPSSARTSRSSGPVRSTPIALVARTNLDLWRRGAAPEDGAPLSGTAERIRGFLAASGASFFDDVVSGLRLVRAEAENALGELVAAGAVTSDAFAGIRALIVPATVRARGHERRQRRGNASFGMEHAGRWSLLASGTATEPSGTDRSSASGGTDFVEAVARTLLRRYGVVLRRVIEREDDLPPWRELLRSLRTLEARGEIRGGRFVAGFSGEQYALPEAVEALRALRRAPKTGVLVSLSAADPLNLIGILTPGERVPALASNRVLYRDGVPVARKTGDGVQILASSEGPERHELETALVRRSVPERLRAHLGRYA